MASIHHLPNEILLRIFDFFETCELLKVDTVCRRWGRVLQEFIWSRVVCIDEKMIDYPHGHYLQNFIEICHRVVRVNQVFTELNSKWRRDDGRSQEALKSAFIEVLGKLSRDCPLPVALVAGVLSENCTVESECELNMFMHLLVHERLPPVALTPMSEARAAVVEMLRELRVDEFEAVEVSSIVLSNPEFGFDPFSVYSKGRSIPLIVHLAHITRLHIGKLRVLSISGDKGGIVTAKSLLSWISCFPRLETVVLRSLEFWRPAYIAGESPLIKIKLLFHPQRCQLSIDEFLAFVRTLGRIDCVQRNRELLSSIDGWKEKNWIASSELVVHSVAFGELVSTGARYSGDEFLICDDNTPMILHRVYPGLTRKLVLIVHHSHRRDESVMNYLTTHGCLAQLRAFSVFFTFEKGESREDLLDWEELDAITRAKNFLRHLTRNMQSFERLKLDFCLGLYHCRQSMFEPITVVGPLPRLRDFSYEDLPCFPFILSVVEQAPKLRYLNIFSQHFEDERCGIKWIEKLLDALERNRQLSILLINVERNSDQNENILFRNRFTKDNEEDGQLLARIVQQVDRLVNVLPKLHRVSVLIKICDFEFEMDRNGRGSL